jgi:hypothetical protein
MFVAVEEHNRGRDCGWLWDCGPVQAYGHKYWLSRAAAAPCYVVQGKAGICLPCYPTGTLQGSPYLSHSFRAFLTYIYGLVNQPKVYPKSGYCFEFSRDPWIHQGP